MRLVLVNPNTNEETTAAMARIAQVHTPADTEIEALTAPFGVDFIDDPVALERSSHAVASLADNIASRAADGVIVAAFGDPGLAALRERLACPVTGIAEASMREAADNRSFAIVTTTPALVPSIEERVRGYGYSTIFRGVFLTQGDSRAAMREPQMLDEMLEETCLRALRESGAKALIIGGGPLAQAAAKLQQRLACTVVEPVPAAIHLALARTGGACAAR